MTEVVYDASALLAVIFAEPGADAVINHLARPGGAISAVNWSEVGAKLIERGLAATDLPRELSAFGLDVVAFDKTQAELAAALRHDTQPLGLSLGDRSCLALTRSKHARVITADKTWTQLAGFDVVCVR